MAEELDERGIRRWWSLERNNGNLTEVRAIGNGLTYSGYFKSIDNLIKEIRPLTDMNLYYVLNSIDDACYSREQCEKMVKKPKNTTQDKEIIGRDFIVIDLDPIRPTGVNATDEELQKSKDTANRIYKYLRDEGFQSIIVNTSGNGVHIKIPVALMNTDDNTELVKRFLNQLSLMFSDENVDVDTSCFNASRLIKIPHTYSRKGVSNSRCVNTDRPQRQSVYVSVPDEIKANNKAYIEKISNLYPEQEQPNKYNNFNTDKFDLDGFILKHGINVRNKVCTKEFTKYVLEECPFDQNHKAPDSALFLMNNGAIGFKCLHASCSKYTWQDVRRRFEPNAYEIKYGNRFNVRPFYNREAAKEFVPQEKTEKKGDVWVKLGDVRKAVMDEKDFIPTGIIEFDRMGLGLMRKHLTVITGLRASGKTSLINMLILNQIQRRFNVGLWSGEMTSSEIKQWMYLQAAGKSYVTKRGNSEYYETSPRVDEKISIWLDKYFSLYSNNYSGDVMQLVSEIRERQKKEFFDILYIDNLMTLGDDSISGSTIEKNKKVLLILSDLAKELNVHIVLVAHPNKSSGLLRLANISGTADISNLAQNVLLWHRVKYDENEYIHDFERDYEEFFGKGAFDKVRDYSNILEVAKFRSKGTMMGRVFGMYYEKESGRFKNSISEHIVYGWQDDPVQQSFQELNDMYNPSDECFKEVDEDCPF